MPRRARSWLFAEAACYHVINRGHARETVFHDDDDRVYFLKLLLCYRDAFDLCIYHDCLMRTHSKIVRHGVAPGSKIRSEAAQGESDPTESCAAERSGGVRA